MNDLQRKQLALLKCFIEACERLQLRWFLVCGSALGAAKYRGFIPWDDDVDVALFRDDYERFLAEASVYLPEGVFLQNYRTDPAFPAIFSKLRDSETTYIERSASRLPIHHGIYIDVFPLDGYPSEKAEQRQLERRKWLYRRLLSAAFRPDRWWKSLVLAPLRLIGVHRHTAAIARHYESMIARYGTVGSAIISNHGNWQGRLEYAPAAQYGEGVWGEFEDLRVRLPERTDAYLTQKYGDWRRDLPPDEQVGHHDFIRCDCERPYRDYL